MTPDELTRPLGLSPPKPRLAGRVRLAIGLLGVAAAAGVVAFLVLQRSADAPFAVSPIVTRDQASPPGDPSAGSRQSAEALEGASGVSVLRPPGEAPPGSIVIRVPEPAARLEPAPDPRLIEHTRFGLLPKVGADGARPARLYARPAVAKSGPRV